MTSAVRGDEAVAGEVVVAGQALPVSLHGLVRHTQTLSVVGEDLKICENAPQFRRRMEGRSRRSVGRDHVHVLVIVPLHNGALSPRPRRVVETDARLVVETTAITASLRPVDGHLVKPD